MSDLSAIMEETASSSQEVSATVEEYSKMIEKLNASGAGMKDTANNLSQSIRKFVVSTNKG